jgi:hypothetical protein
MVHVVAEADAMNCGSKPHSNAAIVVKAVIRARRKRRLVDFIVTHLAEGKGGLWYCLVS